MRVVGSTNVGQANDTVDAGRVYSPPVESRTAPRRLRALPSWLINQASRTAQQVVVDALAEVDAHRYHYAMLAALDEFGPMSQATLGRRVGLDRSDIAAAVADLAARQVIERATDPDDRRRNTVRITRTGQRYLQTLDRRVQAAQEELLAGLSASERRQLVRLLTRLVDQHP